MKITHVETLISRGPFANSNEWRVLRNRIHAAIRAVDWPQGTGKFIIYPESGKSRGKGSGVKLIKVSLMDELKRQGWTLQADGGNLGDIDAQLSLKQGKVVLEWETGNVSSSHRSINKMALLLRQKKCIAGILVVPTKEFSKFLTDRVGNFQELMPYLPLWQCIPCKQGILEIVVIKHDGTSLDVPRIPKGTDGRALG